MKNTLFLSVLFCLVLISVDAYATNWAFCDANQGSSNGLAYADSQLTQRKSVADSICRLSESSATGDMQFINYRRCLNALEHNCNTESLVAAGLTPDPLFGDHDVPPNAWFISTGASAQYPVFRCSCP